MFNTLHPGFSFRTMLGIRGMVIYREFGRFISVFSINFVALCQLTML